MGGPGSPLPTLYNPLPSSFSTPNLTNLICFCFFQRVGTLPWELGRWAGSRAVTIGGADLFQTLVVVSSERCQGMGD